MASKDSGKEPLVGFLRYYYTPLSNLKFFSVASRSNGCSVDWCLPMFVHVIRLRSVSLNVFVIFSYWQSAVRCGRGAVV